MKGMEEEKNKKDKIEFKTKDYKIVHHLLGDESKESF